MTTMNEDIERLKSDYEFMQHLLNQAAQIRRRINTEYGLDEDEMLDNLKHMMAATKAEATALLDMLGEGDIVNDPLLVIREAHGNAESTKNDVTISGVSDTTLLRQLDGRI